MEVDSIWVPYSGQFKIHSPGIGLDNSIVSTLSKYAILSWSALTLAFILCLTMSYSVFPR